MTGKTGYEALLSRALALAKSDFARLESVTVKGGDCVEGFANIEPRLNDQEFVEGETLIIGHLLGLLRTFLGETLVLRLVRDLWPGASFTEPDSGKGSTHESA